jgi:hypothetical protein
MAKGEKVLPTWRRVVRWINQQQVLYQIKRRDCPLDFGSADGALDQTPAKGPGYVFGIYGQAFIVLWGVYKHPWMSRYHYIIGDAVNARGERSKPGHWVDIRDLPPEFEHYVKRIEHADNYLEIMVEMLDEMCALEFDITRYVLEPAGQEAA